MKLKMRKTGLLALAGAAASMGAAMPAKADFVHVSFPDSTGITLVGTATVTNNTVQLNPADRATAGAVWETAKQAVGGGFESVLEVRIANRQGMGADGFAFVIQNSSGNALGSTGGGVGYATNPAYGTAGIADSIAIEFDTFNNSLNWNDTTWVNHASIQTRGLDQNSPDMAYSLSSGEIPDIGDGSLHTVRVVYDAGVLSAYLDGGATPVVSAAVDLNTLLDLSDGNAWVGITASTGALQDAEAHVVESWNLTTHQIPAPGSVALLGMGGVLAARRRRRN